MKVDRSPGQPIGKMVSTLKQDFPSLRRLADNEVSEAISAGGLARALVSAGIANLTRPAKRGRPIQVRNQIPIRETRGAKAQNQLVPTCSNTRAAEFGFLYARFAQCSDVDAARFTLTELGGRSDAASIRSLAKKISDIRTSNEPLTHGSLTQSVLDTWIAKSYKT